MVAKLHKITIGSAQFGMDYGITSDGKPVSADEVRQIFEFARQHDILTIDTAAAYGNAEQVLGQTIPQNAGFRVITKLPSKLDTINYRDIRTQINSQFAASLESMKLASVYGLMLHDTDGFNASYSVELVAALDELRQQGLVKKIGISLYEAFEIDDIFSRFDLDIIQIPINVFDQRLLKDNRLEKLSRKSVEIHARSVFLQGLLLMDEQEVPEHLYPARKLLGNFHRQLGMRDISPLAACLGFVRQLEFIDHMVIGFHSLSNIEQCVAAFNQPCEIDFSQFACEDQRIIDPRVWGKS